MVKSWLLKHLNYKNQINLFLLPYFLGTIVLIILPAIATISVSVLDYNTISLPTWVGLDNFRRLLSSPYVLTAIRNSLIFLLLAVPMRVLAALLAALFLQNEYRWFNLYRAGVYLPTIIPEVSYALIWLWIFNPVYGPLNTILGAVGLPTPSWLTEPTTARLAIIIMSVFQIGEGFVVLIAGLQTIPRSLYEAAKVDGATTWDMFWHITLPLLVPWLMLLTFRDLVVSLQNTFTPSFVMTYGGPYYATTFIPLLLYELAFDYFDFGMSAALLLFTYALVAAVAISVINLLGLGRSTDGD